MVDAGPEHVLNQGIVWDPGTGAGDRYTKRHPVPFGEYIPWRSVFRANFGQLALIPRDMVAAPAPTRCEVAGIDGGRRDLLRRGLRRRHPRPGRARAPSCSSVQTSNAMFIHTGQIDQQFEITRLRALETGRYVWWPPPTASPA